jgi:hypothetical protein
MRHSIQHQIKRIKNSFFQLETNAFNSLFCEDRLTELTDLSGSYRDKIYTPLVTLNAFLWQTLSDNGGCKEAVTRIFAERLEAQQDLNSINTGPYCKARQRLSLLWIIQEVRRIGMKLHEESKPKWSWKEFNVVLVDGTTVLKPDTVQNQQVYPQQSVQKEGLGFPIARVVGLISLSAGTITDYAIGPFQGKGTGETSLFSQLIDTLQPKDLLLADRYYSTYAILATLSSKGAAFVSQNHAQKKVNFKSGSHPKAKDHIVEWHKPKKKPVWMSKEDYSLLPGTLNVREFSVSGIVYVTTLLESKKYPKKELAKLYKNRWKIELDFRTLKTDLKMDMLRCKTPEMVEKEIAIRFMAYNLIRGSLMAAADKHKQTPRYLSFKAATQLLKAVCAQFYNAPMSLMTTNYKHLLKALVSTLIGQRKRPPQPRAVKRRPKAYPVLTKPRSQACEALKKGFCNS